MIRAMLTLRTARNVVVRTSQHRPSRGRSRVFIGHTRNGRSHAAHLREPMMNQLHEIDLLRFDVILLDLRRTLQQLARLDPSEAANLNERLSELDGHAAINRERAAELHRTAESG
jgi:hypothetical protein